MGYNKNPRIKFNCDYCGIIASDKPSAYKRKNRHFCSILCYSKYRKYLLPIEEHNRYGTGAPFEERVKKVRARTALNHAIRDGKIKRLPCSTCGEFAEAHHHDYSRPLDVLWLCFKHHRELHGHAVQVYENPELLK